MESGGLAKVLVVMDLEILNLQQTLMATWIEMAKELKH